MALGGGAYWAYKNGHLERLIDWARGYTAENDASLIYESNASGMSPVFGGADNGMTTEETLLRSHWAEVQPWARANLKWVSAMMWQESRGNTNAISHAGARGLMQVMPGTMGDLVRWGWDRYPADPTTLHLPNVGIYFGTAYLEYLSGRSSDRKWITRAYNAGPGGQRSDGSWPAETVDYLARIKARHALIAQGEFV